MPREQPLGHPDWVLLLPLGIYDAGAALVDSLYEGAADLASNTTAEELSGAASLGREGEAAVRGAYDIGSKQTIDIAGGGTRVPDGLTSTALSEVKNVQSLSYTQQLQDFASYAQQNGLRFDLYVRSDTQLSQPLQQAIQNGQVNLRYIPK